MTLNYDPQFIWPNNNECFKKKFVAALFDKKVAVSHNLLPRGINYHGIVSFVE